MGRIEVDAEQLAAWEADGVAIRTMASRLGVGCSTVRSWLLELDLRTPRSVRLDQTRRAPAAGAERATGACLVHGPTTFVRRQGGVAKCVLLCANCRGEVEAGETRLPFSPPDRTPG